MRVNTQWRYSDTTIREIEHRDVGADLKASGSKPSAFDFSPNARAADFDDSKRESIAADSLESRRDKRDESRRPAGRHLLVVVRSKLEKAVLSKLE